ncbi:hypothetical protein sync_0857 [Synechococcus sp. CC9311]|nr:hypothetical protein sync_0857 [Synechococcus sp. CC9311]
MPVPGVRLLGLSGFLPNPLLRTISSLNICIRNEFQGDVFLWIQSSKVFLEMALGAE